MKVYSFLPVFGNISQFSADVKYFFDYLTHEHQFPAHEQHMLSRCSHPAGVLVSLTSQSLPVRHRSFHGRACQLHCAPVHCGRQDLEGKPLSYLIIPYREAYSSLNTFRLR